MPGECLHVYQRSFNGFNLFYDVEDFIVFYTIASVLSKVYNVSVLSMCQMIDHVHLLVASDSIDDVSSYVRHYTSLYALEFNHDVGRSGPLFHKSFGSAPKKGGKKIRSAIVYIGNNPVEKKLCKLAEQYRWNYIAYMNNSNPFSVKGYSSSAKMERAKSEVRSMVKANKYLSYVQLRRILYGLSDEERNLLIDYIVWKYYMFDNESLMSYYEGYGDMVHAMKSTAGSEYDIKEVYCSGSDSVYREMLHIVKRDFQIVPAKQVIVLPIEKKLMLASHLKKNTSASVVQIAKFLHLDLSSEGNRLIGR